MNILKFLIAALIVLLLLFVAWAFPPWEDSQRGRFYLSYLAPMRAGQFSHWEEVLPYRSIPQSTAPRSYPKYPVDLTGVSYEHNGVTVSLDEYLEKQDIAGLMVLQDGKIRYEFYSEDINADSTFHIWSASKSYTATLIGMALYEGKIESLDDPISKYAPQFEGSAYGETTLHHLLMMSSGVDFKHFDYSPNRLELYFDVVMKRESISEWSKQLGRRVRQGTDFNYLATDTHVLSTALKGVYGKPLFEVVSEKLWEPGGFTADATWSQDAEGDEGVALGHCCLSVTLTDFAHLGQLYLEDLVLEGQQTVPDDWFDWVANPHAGFQEPRVEEGADDVAMGYSYQFWLPPEYDNEFVARGALGQYLWIDRKREFVVAQFSTAAIHNSLEYTKLMRAIGDALSSSD